MNMRRLRILTVTICALGAFVVPSAALASGGGPTPSSPTSSATVAPSLSSVTLGATDVVGGSPVSGIVTLSSPAASGGTLVMLSSDNTQAATVPASVTVPGGSTRASFQVATLAVQNSQSALIIGTAGGVTTYAIITVRTLSSFSNGTISVLAAGSGAGTVTSQPGGIRCAYSGGASTGACSASFPVGTVVRLTAQPASGSKFQGWRGLPGCGDPAKIAISHGSNITCQPGFALK
jgi:hypothetical protein